MVVRVGQYMVMVKGVCEGMGRLCAWGFADGLCRAECFFPYSLVNPFPSVHCLVYWGIPFQFCPGVLSYLSPVMKGRGGGGGSILGGRGRFFFFSF